LAAGKAHPKTGKPKRKSTRVSPKKPKIQKPLLVHKIFQPNKLQVITKINFNQGKSTIFDNNKKSTLRNRSKAKQKVGTNEFRESHRKI